MIHTIRDPIFGVKKGVLEMLDPGVADKRRLFDKREFSSVLNSMKREGESVDRVIRDTRTVSSCCRR